MDEIEVQCPYCGEWVEVAVPQDLLGDTIQDCEVCCHPWKLTVSRDEWGDPDVRVERAE